MAGRGRLLCSGRFGRCSHVFSTWLGRYLLLFGLKWQAFKAERWGRPKKVFSVQPKKKQKRQKQFSFRRKQKGRKRSGRSGLEASSTKKKDIMQSVNIALTDSLRRPERSLGLPDGTKLLQLLTKSRHYCSGFYLFL